jgi:hypothetical protein
MNTEYELDDVQVNCVILGCILALVINYPKLLHGCDSRDVVRSKFLENDECYRLKPRVVTCGWHQGFPALTIASASAGTHPLSSGTPRF